MEPTNQQFIYRYEIKPVSRLVFMIMIMIMTPTISNAP